MAKYRSWPFSVSEHDMANIDKACAELSSAVGAKVSRSEFLRLSAAAATSHSFGPATIANLATMRQLVQEGEESVRQVEKRIKESLADLSPDQLATIGDEIAKMKAKP